MLEAAQRVFCLDIRSSVERKDGKREDQRRALALRMTKAESGLALVARKITALALYHLVLLEASSSIVFPVIKVIRFDYKKVGGKGLRSCKKTFGNCGVDCKASQVWSTKQSVALLCRDFLVHTDFISCEIQPDAGNGWASGLSPGDTSGRHAFGPLPT